MTAIGTTPPIAGSTSGFDPVSIGVSVAQRFLSGGKPSTVKTAASSIVITGEPISSALLSIGNFFLNNAAQQKAAKAGRLSVSTERDKGVTSVLGGFIADYFDPQDPRTAALVAQANADLSNPDASNRGDRQHALKLSAIDLLSDQIIGGRVYYLPQGSELPHLEPSEDAVSIGREIVSSVVSEGLAKAATRVTGRTGADLYTEATGRSTGDPERGNIIDFFRGLFGLDDGAQQASQARLVDGSTPEAQATVNVATVQAAQNLSASGNPYQGGYVGSPVIPNAPISPAIWIVGGLAAVALLFVIARR